MGDAGRGGGNGGSIAAAVIIVLLLVAAAAVVAVVIGILLYKKRYRDQLKSLCFKDGERKELTCSCVKDGVLGKLNCWCTCFKRRSEDLPLSAGIGTTYAVQPFVHCMCAITTILQSLIADNVLYRRESDQMLIKIPKKQKAHLYDIPRNGHGNYDVPRSTPVVHVPEDYQVPKSPAHAAMTKSPARRGTDVYENMPEVEYISCGDGELVSTNDIEGLNCCV